MTGNYENLRKEERYELFVMASMHATDQGGPVAMRNISTEGALIEGEHLPVVGDQFELRRGALTVNGAIIWRDRNKAGLLFDDRIDVSQWMPGAQPQKAVDQTFQQLKEGRHGPPSEATPATPFHSSFITAEDMNETAGALDSLADALSCEVEIVVKYSSGLQSLDIAAQLLRKIATRA